MAIFDADTSSPPPGNQVTARAEKEREKRERGRVSLLQREKRESGRETVMKERSGRLAAASSHLDWATKARKASMRAARACLASSATSSF